MLPDTTRHALHHGPYSPPPVSVGGWLHDERHGLVQVGGWTDAPLPWPRRRKTGGHSPILCGDLVRAVRLESAIAVAYWWGVSAGTVWAWRKALGVGRITSGTRVLYEAYAPQKLPDEVGERGRETAKEPGSRAKIAAARKGQPAHSYTRAALLQAAKARKSPEWREQRSEAMRHKIESGEAKPPRHHPAWTEAELSTLHEGVAAGLTDRQMSEQLGRSIHAVRWARRKAFENKYPAHVPIEGDAD